MAVPPSRTAGTTIRECGTITADRRQRLGAALTGIDIPTLRDVWATPRTCIADRCDDRRCYPRAQRGYGVGLRGRRSRCVRVADWGPGANGTRKSAACAKHGYRTRRLIFQNDTALTGAAVLQRIENVNFGWSTNSPGALASTRTSSQCGGSARSKHPPRVISDSRTAIQ
jgi:hypothetical protein